MNELVFQVTQEADGGFVAEVLSEDIFTQADSWEQLRANVREAVNCSATIRNGLQRQLSTFVSASPK
jgi:hypothetical protein